MVGGKTGGKKTCFIALLCDSFFIHGLTVCVFSDCECFLYRGKVRGKVGLTISFCCDLWFFMGCLYACLVTVSSV